MGVPSSQAGWTVEEDLLLAQGVQDNLSYAAIGAKIGRSKNACISRARRALGITERDRTVIIKVQTAGKPGPKPKQTPVVVEALPPRSATIPQDNEPQPLYALPEASTTAFGEPRRLLDLEPHHCRFPAEERDGQQWFCSAPRDGLLPYCKDHALLCLRPEPKRNLSRLTKAYR